MNFFRKINISSFSPKIAKWYPFRPSFQRFPNDIQRMLYRESTATFQWIHWLLLFYLCVLHDKGQTGRSGVFVSELLRNFSNQGDELILNVVFFCFFFQCHFTHCMTSHICLVTNTKGISHACKRHKPASHSTFLIFFFQGLVMQ